MLRPERSPDVTPLHFYALASWKEKTTGSEEESDMKNSSRISFSSISSISNFVSACTFQFPFCFIRRFLISPQRRPPSLGKYNRKDKSKQVLEHKFDGLWTIFLRGPMVNSYKNKARFCELFVTIQLKSLY